jgi:sugar phosphate isomerase/epimerase
MYLVRNIMFCKPGQVKPMVSNFKALVKALKKAGYKGKHQILTDVASERYWMAVFEMEVESMDSYEEMVQKSSKDKDFQKAMKDYHRHIETGRREIYKIEQ